ncbi:MAG: class I SAM-dependent methyltransferase [Spirulinaceae cyanobacterium SM2_1_0]|nr:class I SAM-dependent methyltransferase [Spirulinaceae cyanobacterium SM2_1_0]
MDTLPEPAAGFSTMSSAIEFADNYNNWIVESLLPYAGLRILEVGTGQGNFRRYLPASQEYVSIDIDSQVIQRASQRDPEGHYFLANIADSTSLFELQKFEFDTILCTNVLEHIEDDHQAIKNMLSLLCPQGKILLFVPAIPFLYSSMDKLAGHYRRYTKQSLHRLVAGDSGGKVDCIEYFNPVGGVGWGLNKLLDHRSLDDNKINKQIEIFDKHIVPISKSLNYFTKSFFGQSLICVISKL